MAFRFVSSAGSVSDPAVVNLAASGVINVGNPVDLIKSQGTGGAVVSPSTSSSTSTMIFGLATSYAQGASNTFVGVIPFDSSQLWEVDCANAASTAQLGIRHALSATRGYVHNTATDIVGGGEGYDGVFLAFEMTGSTSGSGKLIGRVVRQDTPFAQNNSTWA